MPVLELTRIDLLAALQDAGIGAGDGLLVHSALQFLGQPEGGLQMILNTLREAVGEEGTLAVPAFNFGFARGDDYDPYTTPSQGMGAFSEFVRHQPRVLRTLHPMQSLAIQGPHAQELIVGDTCSAFDDGSAFDRMLHMGFKLLLLGADIQAASIVHYSEQRAAVPYRYWKEFTGRINFAGRWRTKTYLMYARNLDLDPQLRLAPIQHSLEAAGQWRSAPLNFGRIASCTLTDFVAVTNGLLAADPWALVTNKPEKVEG